MVARAISKAEATTTADIGIPEMNLREKFKEAEEIQRYITFFRNYQDNDKRILKVKKDFERARTRGLFEALDEPISQRRAQS